ncbi:MAG: hypothetical protein U5L45_05820 [Saprospiraceae bacterium]|nr:hypothetical protein [Saprospiraceae bacterium]
MERAVFFVKDLGFAQIFNKKTARSEKTLAPPKAARFEPLPQNLDYY